MLDWAVLTATPARVETSARASSASARLFLATTETSAPSTPAMLARVASTPTTSWPATTATRSRAETSAHWAFAPECSRWWSVTTTPTATTASTATAQRSAWPASALAESFRVATTGSLAPWTVATRLATAYTRRTTHFARKDRSALASHGGAVSQRGAWSAHQTASATTPTRAPPIPATTPWASASTRTTPPPATTATPARARMSARTTSALARLSLATTTTSARLTRAIRRADASTLPLPAEVLSPAASASAQSALTSASPESNRPARQRPQWSRPAPMVWMMTATARWTRDAHRLPLSHRHSRLRLAVLLALANRGSSTPQMLRESQWSLLALALSQRP